MAMNSYMITNRTYVPDQSSSKILPLSGQYLGALRWYVANAPYDTTPTDYQAQSSNPTATPPPSFIKALLADLKLQGPKAQLTVLIHGLGNLWDDAVTEMATFGQNLQQAGYKGLLIGFSWPSYNEFDSAIWYASSGAFPPPANAPTNGTIRDNINGSVQSFGSLMTFLENLVAAARGQGQTLTVSFACHSEGNYMLMLGMWNRTSLPIDQVLMFAADVDVAVLQVPTPAMPTAGYARYVASNAARVTVYYSGSDDTLAQSLATFGPAELHNPVFGGRLGLQGPSFNCGAQHGNCVGVDCSLVVNEQNIVPPLVPPFTILHASYFYVPQILADMTQTLNGTSSGSVTNRMTTAQSNSYVMKFV